MTVGLNLSTDRLRGRAVVRDPDEPHRASTPLELLFDLVFVVAVGRAASALHHELAAGHVGAGLFGFVGGFFAVWWAWMNYTWMASAHDSDDVAFRLLTLVQMAGALVLASGITEAVEHEEFTVVVIGYVIMRMGLVACWLRVARDEPSVRQRALRYAGLICAAQVLWVLRLALPDGAAQGISFLVLVLIELSIPVLAERTGERPVFHSEHIEERYGLFTIIVLGESILSATAGFQLALDEGGLTSELTVVGLAGLVAAFAAWWLYFAHPGHLAPEPSTAFRWGYAHVLVFAALAGFGAGIHVAAEAVTHHGEPRIAAYAVTIPMAGFLLGLVVIMMVTGVKVGDVRIVPKLIAAAVLVVVGAAASVPMAVLATAIVMAALATMMVLDEDASPPAHA